MTALKFVFYSPLSDDNDDVQDGLMHHIWSQRAMDYLIFVRRMSSRGNPYIGGLFVSNEEVILPPEFEVRLIPDEHYEELHQQFKEEQRNENNATEYGPRHR